MAERQLHDRLTEVTNVVRSRRRFAPRRGKNGATRSYLLAGLVQCRLCGRRMDAHWVNGRAGYRCRHGHHSARTRPAGAPRNLYVRADELLDRLGTRLASDEHRSIGDGHPGTSEEIVAQLRAESQVIVCGRGDWTLTGAG
jgi:hypothetical protein